MKNGQTNNKPRTGVVTQELADQVKAGQMGFAIAVHKLVSLSQMELDMAQHLIHEAMQ
jgi:hypothetical protein